MFTREPAVVFKVLEEIVRAAIPMALIFGWIHWTETQTGAVLLFVGVLVGAGATLLTRSQTTPDSQVNALIRTATQQAPGTQPDVVKEIQAAKDNEGK